MDRTEEVDRGQEQQQDTNNNHNNNNTNTNNAAVVLSPKLTAYLIGQCCNVIKVALWWTALSPLVLALTGRDESIGSVRVAFNVALMLVSPFAGVLAGGMEVRKTLIWTTLGRGFIWAIALPLIYVFLTSGLVGSAGIQSPEATLGALVVLGLLDGSQVAFSNIVDIDSGGVDILAGQHKLLVNDGIRNKMNAIHQIVFDGSMVILTPLMALLSIWLGNQIHASSVHPVNDDSAKTGGLVTTFALVFFVMTVVSLFFYQKFLQLPVEEAHYGMFSRGGDGTSVIAPADIDQLIDEEDGRSTRTDVQQKGCCALAGGLFGAIAAGAKVCWKNGPIRWRLLFLGLEVALEDTMIAVVISETAFMLPGFANNSSAVSANLWTAIIVAVGKIGALLAGFFMHSLWVAPPANTTGRRGYLPLFISVLLGALSVLLFPLAASAAEAGASITIQRGLVFLGAFLFFLFSTAPKIGFETLLQAMASKADASGPVFGFVGTAITIIDSVVVLACSLIFAAFKGHCEEDESACLQQGLSNGLWSISGIYAAHGILEVLLGPTLMLSQRADDDDEDALRASHREPLLGS